MNLQKEITDELGKELSAEIDREVLWGMLSEMGWTRIMIDRRQDNRHAIDITYWLEANCVGPYQRHGRDFIFENSVDAVNFILKWK